MSLRPQDVLVLAKLLVYGDQRRPPMAQVGLDLGLSSSAVHASLHRLQRARLLVKEEPYGTRPNLQAVEEFLVHGVKYVFPAERGPVTRGVPTSYAAPPLREQMALGSDLPPVWPQPDGVPGVALQPLYRTAAGAALRDQALYEILALIDAIREGRTRERKLAEAELHKRIQDSDHARP